MSPYESQALDAMHLERMVKERGTDWVFQILLKAKIAEEQDALVLARDPRR